MSDLYCFNPITGKRDGGYCVWEGAGKCMKCEAADKYKALVEVVKFTIKELDLSNHKDVWRIARGLEDALAILQEKTS